MAKAKKSELEKIESARIFVENHLAGHLTPRELESKLKREGMNYTKIHKNSKLVFVLRGDGIQRTELTF